jgi:hypothetical protein
MSICIRTGQDHHWEFGYVHHGEQWKVCADCGEQELDFYHDCGSGC